MMKEVKHSDRDQLDFGKDNIPGLFRKLFFPTLLGMVFNAALTVADGIFTGQGVGADGIAAVNIVAPLFMVATGIGLMSGIGASVIASVRLANQDFKSANIITTQAFATGMLLTALIAALCMAFPKTTVGILGSSAQLEPLALSYMHWILPGTLCLVVECVGMMLIRLDGSPQYAMMCNVIPATINIVLDYVMIFPMNMGVKGAAMATSISCLLGSLMVLAYFLRYSSTLRFYPLQPSLANLRLTLRNTGYMFKIGFATFLTELAMSVMMFTGNHVFIDMLGEEGVAAFSIACYLFPVIFSMSNAVAQSIQPVISYNYGAGNMARVSQALRTALAAALICGPAVTAGVAFGAETVTRMFLQPGGKAFELACEGLPLYALCGIFFALNIAFIGYYQSLEKACRATAFTLLRGMLVVVPAFILLPRLWGIPGLWLAIPASEIITFLIITTDFLLHKRRKPAVENS